MRIDIIPLVGFEIEVMMAEENYSFDFQLRETSEQIAKLAEALCKAQSEMKPASKDRINPHLKSGYADLTSVWDAIREPMTKHGLSIAQYTKTKDGTLDSTILVTKLMHSPSGEWLRGELPVKPAKPDHQGLGSAISYARRYAICSMLGVTVADEDDDGNAASSRSSVKLISKDQQEDLLALVEQAGASVDKLLAAYKIKQLSELTADQFEQVSKQLQAKKKGS